MEDDLHLKREALMKKEAELLKIENELLKKQLEMYKSFEDKAGFHLNNLTIDELFDKKILERTAADCSKNTLFTYSNAKEYFQRYCNERGLTTPQEVTRDHAEEFYLFLKKQKGRDGNFISKFRVIQIYKVVKATFHYAEQRDSIIKNPFQNKVFPKSPVNDWWTDEYFYELIKAIRKYARISVRFKYELIIRILYTTGLRIGLLLDAKLKGFHKTDDGRVYLTTKRKVPKSSEIQEVTVEILNNKTRKMLSDWVETQVKMKGIGPEDKIFLNLVSHSFSKTLKKISAKAGIKFKNLHKAKHGFITKMLLKGYTSSQICKLTGNSTPRLIDEVYSHIQAKDFREKVKRDLEDV